MSEWKKVKLGEIGKIITGKTPPTKDKDNYGGNIPFITPVDMVGNRNVFITERYLTEKGKNVVKNCLLPANTICVSCIGSDMGKAVITTQPSITNQQINSIIVDDAYDFRFVFYLMLTQTDVIKSLGKNSTAVPILNKSKFCNIEVSLPSLSTQHRIAAILSRYDSLIENYQKQIKLLEEAAQRLYKNWFVDLHFPGHENTKIVDGVPEGWEKKKAIDFFEMSIGKTPPRAEKEWFSTNDKDVPWVSISDMKNVMFVNETGEKLTQEACNKFNVKIVPEGTVLLSFKLTVGRVSIADIPVCTNEAIAHFMRSGNSWREYTLLYLRNYHYDSLGNTSGISKAVNSTIIKNMPFLMPCGEILESFSRVVSPIFLKIKIASSQIRLLTEARDRLLPKLMSGEIAV